jgi:hypothetical protein
MTYALRLTQAQHRKLRDHLFPGDGKEAVAILLCGRRAGSSRYILTAREIHPVPYEQCLERTPTHVKWSTDIIDSLLPSVIANDFCIVKIHSHVTDWRSFSDTDDCSDENIFGSITNLLGNAAFHASTVMLPSGEMFGRTIIDGKISEPLTSIMVVGDDLQIWQPYRGSVAEEFNLRHRQAFGEGTSSLLRALCVAVVGCSGTGSFVVEELARLGVGRLVLIDPDRVEEKNLNRIVNSSKEDAYLGVYKVHALAKAIARMGLNQQVTPMPVNLITQEAVMAVAECDIVFGCTDSVEARHILNRLATFYSMPYFDVGVRLDADGRGGISGISGAVHYLQPGRSSLLSREVYTMDQVEAEGMRRTNPDLYQRQRREGYLRGVQEDRPAVITINGTFASMAVQELLARLHPYRNRPNSEFAYVGGSLAEVQLYTEPEGDPCRVFQPHVGRGDMTPLLNMTGIL